MCVAGVGCFGGLALVVTGGSSEWIVIGVLVGGIGLATLLRFMSQLIADEINNATEGPEEPS